MPVSEETKDFLDQVKKGKPRKFVMIVKGATILNLVLYKKGVATKYIKEAKDAIDGPPGIPYFGVVTGKGVDINFQMSVADGFKASPVKTPVLKKYLEEEADFKCMPLVEIVEHTPLVIDPDDELHARFLALQPKVTSLCDALPHEAGPLTATVRDIGKTLDLEQRDDAKIRIDLFEEKLEKLQQQVNFQEQRQKIEPLLRMVQRVAPDKATAMENIWVYSETQAEAGNYKKALDGLLGLTVALKKVDVKAESEKSNAEKLGITPGVVGENQAKFQYDIDYGALKSRIAEVIKRETGNFSQAVKDKSPPVATADLQVTTTAGEGKFAEASELIKSLKLADLLTEAESAMTQYDLEVSEFTKGYYPLHAEIDGIINTWGDAIPVDLKNKRSELESAANQIVAQWQKYEFAAANQLFVHLDVAEKLRLAKEAKQTFDRTESDFNNDYGPLEARALDVENWGADISVELVAHQTAVAQTVKSITDVSDALDFVSARALISTLDLEAKLNAAEADKLTFDQAKIRVDDFYSNWQASVDEILGWPNTVTTDMQNERDTLRGSYDLVIAQSNINEYVEADRLLVSEDVIKKIEDAFDQADSDCDDLYDELDLFWANNFVGHTHWTVIQSQARATENVQTEAQDDADNKDYGIAFEKYLRVKREYAALKSNADKYGEFAAAKILPQKYIDELKSKTWKACAKAVLFCEPKLVEAENEALAFDFVKAQKCLTAIADRYKKVFTDEFNSDVVSMPETHLKNLAKHKRSDVIATEIKLMTDDVAEAKLANKNGIFKTANSIIFGVKSRCESAKRIADACVEYDDAVKDAKLKLKDLTTRVKPAVADDVEALKNLLVEAEKLARPDVRSYLEAKRLVEEIQATYPSLKKILDDFDRTAKQKTDALNQDPTDAIKELRRQIAEFGSKPDEVQQVVKKALETAEAKLKEADLLLVKN